MNDCGPKRFERPPPREGYDGLVGAGRFRRDTMLCEVRMLVVPDPDLDD